MKTKNEIIAEERRNL